MCGIAGFSSKTTSAVGPLANGLGRLEYRGCEIDRPRNLAKSVTVE